jgi:hypothetical protein
MYCILSFFLMQKFADFLFYTFVFNSSINPPVNLHVGNFPIYRLNIFSLLFSSLVARQIYKVNRNHNSNIIIICFTDQFNFTYLAYKVFKYKALTTTQNIQNTSYYILYKHKINYFIA